MDPAALHRVAHTTQDYQADNRNNKKHGKHGTNQWQVHFHSSAKAATKTANRGKTKVAKGKASTKAVKVSETKAPLETKVKETKAKETQKATAMEVMKLESVDQPQLNSKVKSETAVSATDSKQNEDQKTMTQAGMKAVAANQSRLKETKMAEGAEERKQDKKEDPEATAEVEMASGKPKAKGKTMEVQTPLSKFWKVKKEKLDNGGTSANTETKGATVTHVDKVDGTKQVAVVDLLDDDAVMKVSGGGTMYDA